MQSNVIMMQAAAPHPQSLCLAVLSLHPCSSLPAGAAQCFERAGALAMEQDSKLALFLPYCKNLVHIALLLSDLAACCAKWEPGCPCVCLFAVRMKSDEGM